MGGYGEGISKEIYYGVKVLEELEKQAVMWKSIHKINWDNFKFKRPLALELKDITGLDFTVDEIAKLKKGENLV